MSNLKGLDNYIPEPIHILPSHLAHEFLTGETSDTKLPFIINTISGIISAQDKHIAASYLKAEFNLLLSFNSFPFIVHDVTYFNGSENIPTNMNIYLKNNEKLPEVGIICMGYVSLFKAVVSLPIPLELCIQYAINICEGLGETHQRMLIHRNLNPSSLMMHHSGQVHLCGFHLSHNYLTDVESVEYEFNTSKRSMAFEEIDSLVYISPEHTGRVKNRPDQRSDMYSLGIILYEMITGAPPFQYEDPLEMIHAHIARPPPPISSLSSLYFSPAPSPSPSPSSPSLSPLSPLSSSSSFSSPSPSESPVTATVYSQNSISALSDIINVLLSKDPERRYLTPIGLKADLVVCQDMLIKYGEIRPFPLRKKDLLAYSRITGGILCRQKEINMVKGALSIVHSKSSIIFVSGPAGVGKTSLVKVMMKDVTDQGIFGCCKFEELSFYSPTKFLGPVSSAIRHLLVQSMSSADMTEWRKMLLKVISGCERIFLDMFPQMEAYVGDIAISDPLPATERNLIVNWYRMHTMISDLIVMLSSFGSVILFFDDLQWADKASLELIEVIANARDVNTLIIASYRELNPELNDTIQSLYAFRKDLCLSIALEAFNEDNVLELLGESLQVENKDQLRDLAKLVYEKTSGNPLFVVQFLAQMYRRSLVYFDWDTQEWKWDGQKINELGYSGLVSFFLDVFHDLSPETRNMLSFAALLGHKFKFSVLCHFAEMFDFPAVSLAVIEATKNGFLAYMGKNEYSFIHDKIYQSAYLLSSESTRERVYYEIGMYFLSSQDEEDVVASFQYLKHACHKLLEKAKEDENACKLTKKVIEIAIDAGITAKNASAYNSALEYLMVGKNLGAINWENNEETAFQYSTAIAECMYLTGSHKEALLEFEDLFTKPLSTAQRVTVYDVEMQVLASAVDYNKAIEIGLKCCQFLDFKIDDLDINIKLTDNLIKSTDLNNVLQAPELSACEMVRITIEKGPSPTSPTGLGLFAMFYAPDFHAPYRAYELSKLGVDLYQRFPLSNVKSKVYFLYSIVNPWKMPLSDNFQHLYAALQASQECGDFLYRGYSIVHIACTMLMTGRNIQEILAEERVLAKQLVTATEFSDMILVFGISLGYSSLLAGLTLGEDSYTTIDGSVNESNYLPEKKNQQVVECWYTASKVESLYMFGYYNEAIEKGEYLLSLLGALKGHIHEARGLAYYALALLATRTTYEEGTTSVDTMEENIKIIEKVKGLYKYLQIWVDYCSHNFAHYDFLINAEIARVEGKLQLALSFYDKAELHARSTSLFYIKALTNELLARCADDVKLISLSEMALKKSIKGYKTWGAIRKIKQLYQKYSHLLASASPLGSSIELPRNLSQSTRITEESTSTDLDMRTIIKANHVLSQELTLPQVLQKFTNIVLENVGAEQAAIILVDKNSPNSWRVASSWNVKEEQHNSQDGKLQTSSSSSSSSSPSPTPPSPSLATITTSSPVHMIGARKHLVNYVMHTKSPVAIESFEKSEFYDPLQSLLIGSVLCVPIELKGNLCGVVYLEHSVPMVLQADRLDLMSLLCNQLYISIENANLYDSIQASEHRYKMLAEGLPIMAFSRESKGSTFANSKLIQFLGFPSNSAESLSLEQVIANIHKDDLRSFMSAWNQAVDPARPPAEVEMRMRRACDGLFRWTLCHVSVSFDAHNHAEMLLATWMDIQDLKDAQEEQLEKAEIEASEKKYRILAEAIPQIVWTSAVDGKINYFNQRWYEYSGLSEEESLGKKYRRAFHPDDLHLWPSLHDIKSQLEIKLRIRTRDGLYRWHLGRAIYLPTSDGKRFGTFTDIEDQVRTEMSLTNAREAADRAAHNQAFFVANMSHEIRTPMNGLVGMLHLLLSTDLNEEQRDYGDTMKRSADSLLRIIDDVLDFSKIQEGKLELRSDVVNVEAILEDVTETLSVLATGAELMIFVHQDVPARLIGDSGKLRQVCINLIGNAVKFTPTGEVYTSCYVEKKTEDSVLLKFKVVDTGEGISKEKQNQLFTPFYQADATSTRAHGGTGLGLAICKQLVTLFQGEIGVESTLGKGATFTFTALLKLSPEQQLPLELPYFSPSWNALIVSNLPISLQILENHLQTCKLAYTTTTSEEQAVKILKQEKSATFSCVVIDLFSHLQKQQHPSNLQQIISLVGQNQTVLIVNPLQRPSLVREFPKATFLIKPVTFQKFVLALHGRCESPEKKSIDREFVYSKSSRVLIVEDNKVNQKVIAMFLNKEQVMYSIANNGLEAFQMVKEKPFGYYSLILLDLAMPIWDGYKACEEIRILEDTNGGYRHPIVALTANVQDGIIDDCKSRGMDDVISKPVDFKNLSKILMVYLPKLQ